MEIKATQEKLSKALASVSRIATGRVSLPVLNNVLIRVKDKKVSLITTNLDLAIIDFLPVSDSKDGVITVPAKLLTEFVSTLPKEKTITITNSDDKVTISTDKYSSTINGASADDFPELPEIDENNAVVFKIGAPEFKRSMDQIICATSRALERPALTGVLFTTYDNALVIAATDGYRLAEKKLVKNVKSEVHVIVPSSSLQEVLHSIDDNIEEIELSFSNDLVRFRLGEIEIISKLIDASYPEYRKLFPKDSNIHLKLNRDELIRNVKLAALFARRSTDGAIICESKKPNLFSIRSIANELGENDSTIETTVDEEGRIYVNSRHLLDALNAFDEPEISFNFGNHQNVTTPNANAIVLRNCNNDDYIHSVMLINR